MAEPLQEDVRRAIEETRRLVEKANSVAWMSLVVSVVALVGGASVIIDTFLRFFPVSSGASSGVETGLALGILGISLTLMLWGVDKILDAYDLFYASHHPDIGRFQRGRRILNWVILAFRFGAGLLFIGFGVYIYLLLRSATG